jgi:hypothetical protein
LYFIKHHALKTYAGVEAKFQAFLTLTTILKMEAIRSSETLVHFYQIASHPKSYLLTYGAEPFLRSLQFCSHSRTSQDFMEPEVSISCSQEPSAGPYPEPYQSNPLHPILFLLRKFTNTGHSSFWYRNIFERVQRWETKNMKDFKIYFVVSRRKNLRWDLTAYDRGGWVRGRTACE